MAEKGNQRSNRVVAVNSSRSRGSGVLRVLWRWNSRNSGKRRLAALDLFPGVVLWSLNLPRFIIHSLRFSNASMVWMLEPLAAADDLWSGLNWCWGGDKDIYWKEWLLKNSIDLETLQMLRILLQSIWFYMKNRRVTVEVNGTRSKNLA